MSNSLSTTLQYRLADLTDGLDVTIKGDPNCMIEGVSPIQSSRPGSITFLNNSQYKKYLPTTDAAAVILGEKDAVDCEITAVISANPYHTYAHIASFFEPKLRTTSGVHSSVVIGEKCHIAESASIGAHCTLGSHITIGPNVVIGPGCHIGDHVTIGESSQINARVTIYHFVKIGKRVNCASGVVIGSDGFGFANERGRWHKVPQLGSVRVGDDVDIGANTTIDRGAIEDTIIENGVKLDNLIQVGHNVRIGENTIIAGCVAIAGSTNIGKNCMIGGGTCFAGHLSVCDTTMITGMSAVTKSILSPGVYSSGVVGMVPNHEFRKNNARFHRLGSLMDRVKSLENQLKDMTERKSS